LPLPFSPAVSPLNMNTKNMSESSNDASDCEHGDSKDESLWDSLHDSSLVSVSSDPMARTVTLVLKIEHLRKFGHLSEGVTWRLVLHSASKLLARRWEVWPGPSGELKNLTRAEETAVVAEYQSKARTVSLSWTDFEKDVALDALWIKDATLFRQGSTVVLKAEGNSHDGYIFYEFNLTGEKLQFERSDGTVLTIDELLTLGGQYWDEFSKNDAG
jgi:hypothetical protein